MQRLVYVDGQYVEENEAKISVFDRGFLFADAVYEVTAVIDGKLVDFADHITRLQRSCRELSLTLPVTPEALKEIHDELINKNDLKEGAIYLQLSRGNAGDRDFYFPSADVKSTLVLFTQARSLVGNPKPQRACTLSPPRIFAGSVGTSKPSACSPPAWQKSMPMPIRPTTLSLLKTVSLPKAVPAIATSSCMTTRL